MRSRISTSEISLAFEFWRYSSTRMAKREAKKTVMKTLMILVMLNPLCLKIIIEYLLFSFILSFGPYLLTLWTWSGVARGKLRLRITIIFRIIWLKHNEARGDLGQYKSCKGDDQVKGIHYFNVLFCAIADGRLMVDGIAVNPGDTFDILTTGCNYRTYGHQPTPHEQSFYVTCVYMVFTFKVSSKHTDHACICMKVGCFISEYSILKLFIDQTWDQ